MTSVSDIPHPSLPDSPGCLGGWKGGAVTYVARRVGPSTAVAELGSMSTSLRERPPPRPLAPRLPREGRRRSLTRRLSERPRRPDSLDPEAKDRVRPGQIQGETRTGRDGGDQDRGRRGETRTGRDGETPGQGETEGRPAQGSNMQQKRGESQKDQCNFGVQGQWGVVRRDTETGRGGSGTGNPVGSEGLPPPFPEAGGWGAEPGGEAGRGVSILSSSAGRVVSPPTPHRGVGEGVAPGGRGGAGRNGGGASPPPTQGPGTHLFHFLGREGDRVRGGPRGNPTHLPHPPQGPQSSSTRTGRGQSLPPNCEGDRAPGHGAQRAGGREGGGAGRQEQGGWAGGLRMGGGDGWKMGWW